MFRFTSKPMSFQMAKEKFCHYTNIDEEHFENIIINDYNKQGKFIVIVDGPTTTMVEHLFNLPVAKMVVR